VTYSFWPQALGNSSSLLRMLFPNTFHVVNLVMDVDCRPIACDALRDIFYFCEMIYSYLPMVFNSGEIYSCGPRI
jgi:hypothetical protein